MENVTWTDASDYCKAVGMRLPTETEWEYAARAGNPSARYGDLERIAWYNKNNGGGTRDVRGKDPNPWGLYDMLGNVSEWVADWYGPYQAGDATDPKGPDRAQYRLLRGGAWREPASEARVSSRYRGKGSSDDLGFRCAGN